MSLAGFMSVLIDTEGGLLCAASRWMMVAVIAISTAVDWQTMPLNYLFLIKSQKLLTISFAVWLNENK